MASFAAASSASSPVSSMQATRHFTLMLCKHQQTALGAHHTHIVAAYPPVARAVKAVRAVKAS